LGDQGQKQAFSLGERIAEKVEERKRKMERES